MASTPPLFLDERFRKMKTLESFGKFLSQAIFDNSKAVREVCGKGKSAQFRPPLLCENDVALPRGGSLVSFILFLWGILRAKGLGRS